MPLTTNMLINKIHDMHIYQNNCVVEKKYCANTFILIAFSAGCPYLTAVSKYISNIKQQI